LLSLVSLAHSPVGIVKNLLVVLWRLR
jgi:hypothetical protein